MNKLELLMIFIFGVISGISLFLAIPWVRGFVWIITYGDLCFD